MYFIYQMCINYSVRNFNSHVCNIYFSLDTNVKDCFSTCDKCWLLGVVFIVSIFLKVRKKWMRIGRPSLGERECVLINFPSASATEIRNVVGDESCRVQTMADNVCAAQINHCRRHNGKGMKRRSRGVPHGMEPVVGPLPLT